MEQTGRNYPSNSVFGRTYILPVTPPSSGRTSDPLPPILARSNLRSLGALGHRTRVPAHVKQASSPDRKASDATTLWGIRSLRRGNRPFGKVRSRTGASYTVKDRVLQHLFCGSQERWRHQANPESEAIQQVPEKGAIQNGDTKIHNLHCSARRLAGISGPEGRISTRPHRELLLEIPPICPSGARRPPVESTPIRDLSSSFCVHTSGVHPGAMAQVSRDPPPRISGRHTPTRELSSRGASCTDNDNPSLYACRFHYQCQEIRSAPITGTSLHRRTAFAPTGAGLSPCRQERSARKSHCVIQLRRSSSLSSGMDANYGSNGSDHILHPSCQTKNATNTVACQRQVERNVLRDTCHGHQPGERSPHVVVNDDQLVQGFVSPVSPSSIHGHNRCINGRVGWPLPDRGRSPTLLREVVPTRTSVMSHQCVGTQSSTSHVTKHSESHHYELSEDRVRQFHSSQLPQPAGRYCVSDSVSGSLHSARVGYQVASEAHCSASPGNLQPACRLPQQEPTRPSRVVTGTKSLQSPGKAMGATPSGLVCFGDESQSSSVVQSAPPSSSSGGGRIQPNWTGWYVYAFPPINLLLRTILKLRNDRVQEAILVAPYWPKRPWFHELLRMASEPPLRFPLEIDLLQQRLQDRGVLYHQDLKMLELTAWKLSAPCGQVQASANE